MITYGLAVTSKIPMGKERISKDYKLMMITIMLWLPITTGICKESLELINI